MTAPTNLPAIPYEGETGLEDFQVSRIQVPRLTIDHKASPPAFVDSLTGEVYSQQMRMIVLGMVSQRILWHVTPGAKGELPLCKSTDYEHGFPTADENLPRDKSFPWEKSGFDPADYPAEQGLNGLVTLPCASCALAKWDSHPLGKKPYCSEMYTFPVMYVPLNADPDMLIPALWSVRSTGLKAANAYMTRYKTTNTPMFTVWTTVMLQQVTRSGNAFAVPQFVAGEPTDRDRYSEFVQIFRAIRETIRRAPSYGDQDDMDTSAVSVPTAGTSMPTSPPPAAPRAAPAPPAPAPAAAPAAAPADEDDLPF